MSCWFVRSINVSYNGVKSGIVVRVSRSLIVKIECPKGCVFTINKGIPRFVSSENYSSSFGLQWQRYPKTQLDSYTGQPISRKRLEDILNMPLEALKGKVILEVGSGAGRFTELLIENCGFLVSIDFSNAVDANLKNCTGKNPYLLIQGDINNSPISRRIFDFVICLGVIPTHSISGAHNCKFVRAR